MIWKFKATLLSNSSVREQMKVAVTDDFTGVGRETAHPRGQLQERLSGNSQP